jgi:integrating conjugative element membrane protein (TIGR03747 family)
MTDSASAQRAPARAHGLVASLLMLPLQLFGVLCGSLLLSILVELIGMHWIWPEEGWHHAQALLEREIDRVPTHFPRSLLIEEPGQTTRRWVLSTYDQLFVKTGVLERARTISARARAHADRAGTFQSHLRALGMHMEAYALAACYTLLTFLVRIVVLCLMLPLFCMAAVVGVIDGLVRRDVRRFGAGRESGFVYHRAKASLLPLTVLPWVIYLALPVHLHALWILLPSAIGLGVAVNVAAGAFKKYL